MVITYNNITDRKRAEAAIRESEERLHQAVRVSQIGIFDHDHRADTLYWSPELRSIYGFGQEETITLQLYFKHVYPEDIERIAQALREAHDPAGDGFFDVEHRILDRNGAIHWLSTRSRTQFEGEGSLRHKVRTIGAVADITERKLTEKKIGDSLKENEILLKEIHHRVKNNLQIISSLLYLQSTKLSDAQSLEVFNEGQNRIRSMVLIHEQLYRSSDLARINFEKYIYDITYSLAHSYGSNPVNYNINAEGVYLGVDQAIPCGLIINELISNALKYAFLKGKQGQIDIDFRIDNSNYLTLIVKDNGIGFPKDLDFRNTTSLGLQIVNKLVNQLEGTIELNIDDGTEFIIKFPAQK